MVYLLVTSCVYKVLNISLSSMCIYIIYIHIYIYIYTHTSLFTFLSILILLDLFPKVHAQLILYIKTTIIYNIAIKSLICLIHFKFINNIIYNKIISLNACNLYVNIYHGILYEGICFCRNLM